MIRVKINIVGKDGVGKSCFKRSMLKQKFQHQPSTYGIAESTAIAAEVTVSDARDWTEISPEVDDMIDRVIALSAAQIAEADDCTVLSLSEEGDESDAVACNENGPGLSEDIGDLTYSVSPELESSPCESPCQSKYQEVKDIDVPLEPFFDITTLTSSKKSLIEKFRASEGARTQESQKMSIKIWDHGGQLPFLPSHAQLMLPDTAYLLGFDASKDLESADPSSYRPAGTATPIAVNVAWASNYDAMSDWLTMIHLARGASELAELLQGFLGACGKEPHLGACKGVRAPVVILFGTHANEVDEAMKKKQNQFLSRQFRGKAFQEHILRPSSRPDDWFFLVENAVSDPDSDEEDPGVAAIKKVIQEISTVFWQDRPIPTKWYVLENTLDVVPLRTGSPIIDMSTVRALAYRICGIVDEKELFVALIYLASAGSIVYMYQSELLKNKVITDPRWLFKVLSAFVILIPPLSSLLLDWDRVRTEGIMSWALAQYRLEEAGIKLSDYPVALSLLECFNVIGQRALQSLVPSAARHETEYFVPSLLEQNFDGLLFAEHHRVESDWPLSLIIVPEEVDSIPEPLHFRLMKSCVQEFPDQPFLRRNYAIYHVDDLIDLEVVYYARKYIIVSVDVIDSNVFRSNVAKRCTQLREFLTDQLNVVKQIGLSSFKFNWWFQHPGPTIPITKGNLVPLRRYDSRRRLLCTKDRRRIKLEDCEWRSLEYWFYQEKVTFTWCLNLRGYI